MPFCPRCRYEYNPGISKCPDCDEYLVDRLPLDEDEGENEDEVRVDPNDVDQEWIMVARIHYYYQAEMLVQGLRAKDIPVVMYSSSGNVARAGGEIFLPSRGAYAIMIPSEYIVQADKEASLMLGEDWERAKLIDIEE